MSLWRNQFLLLLAIFSFFLILASQAGLAASKPHLHFPKLNLLKKIDLTGQQLEQRLVADSDPRQESLLTAFSLKEDILKDPYYFNSSGELLPLPSSYVKEKDIHLIISDTYNHRILEVDRDKHVLWQYGHSGSSGTEQDYLHYPSFAEPLEKGEFLVTDLGNDRVLRIDQEKGVLWQYGTTLFQGGEFGELYLAETATRLEDGNILVTDTSNHRVIMISPQKKIVWQYGKGYRGTGENELDSPQGSAEAAGNNLLISDTGNHRVILVNRQKKVLWQYGRTHQQGTRENELNLPNMATELLNGNVLICDSGNHRIIEVNRKGHIVWQYGKTAREGSGFNELKWPYNAYRLYNGNTLITDSDNDRIIEVDLYHRIVWQYGKTGIKGAGYDELDAPYDAHLYYHHGEMETPEGSKWTEGGLIFSRLSAMEKAFREKGFAPTLPELSVSRHSEEPISLIQEIEKELKEPLNFPWIWRISIPDIGRLSNEGEISAIFLMEQENHLPIEGLLSWNFDLRDLKDEFDGYASRIPDQSPFYFSPFSYAVGPSALGESVMYGYEGRLEKMEQIVHHFYYNPCQLILTGIRLAQFQGVLPEKSLLSALEREIRQPPFLDLTVSRFSDSQSLLM